MKARHLVATAFVGLLLAGCGESTSSDTGASARPTATPDAVAAAFASAFASGDTPTACGYTAGRARQNMDAGSLCMHSGWPAATYWLDRQCSTPAVDYPDRVSAPAKYTYIYGTNGVVAGADGFAVDVTGADRAWQVTAYTPGPVGELSRICTILESAQSTEASS